MQHAWGANAIGLQSIRHKLATGGMCRYLSAAAAPEVAQKKKLVILGSGWAGCNLIQSLGPSALQQYDITMVSPNNYFVYTPMLPSVTVGTLEPRSIVEPVRNFIGAHLKKMPEAKMVFAEAEAIAVDPKTKKVKCLDTALQTPVKFDKKKYRSSLSGAKRFGSPSADGAKKFASSLEGARVAKGIDGTKYMNEFNIPYDVLVLGVGATTNTFGTPGAMDHCLFLKSIADAQQIRNQLMDCFETADVARTNKAPQKEIDRLLSFVVVGAGPTGVEVAAELRDFILDSLVKAYPQFKDSKIRVTIVEMGDKVLNTYDKAISEYTAQRFNRQDIEVLTKHQVKRVNETSIEVLDLASQEQKVIPFGMCVWASGVRPNDVSLDLAKSFGTRMLETDPFLRVRGSEGSIFALGDCAKISMPSMKAAAKQLFEQADTNKDGVLSEDEFVPMMEEARSTYPHMEAYLGAVSEETLRLLYDKTDQKSSSTERGITPEAFEAALSEIDKEIKMLPPTAQVATQQGVYLGQLLTEVPYEKLAEAETVGKSFDYNHQGSMAYVGGDRAVIDSPLFGVSKGFLTMIMWRGAYWGKSVSLRCKVLMAFDWAKAYVLGRDTSRI